MRKMIPEGTPVLLVGDTEFEGVAVQDQVDAWGWGYALRQKPTNQVRISAEEPWQDVRRVINASGERRWLPNV
ncbi:MAG: hypothetical protein EI684_15045 [Candidatus Viridilinea halotolerans]|uniref:Uncharacterized protein n=1 Tax=Candidatus Viridilinea halotolerans TaxID=2491704 RepID=A0A426TVW6_9CHLR|nr:MAG: hypothetical protein EI684_15045 [Candidatus Viridilinea halotolerans]